MTIDEMHKLFGVLGQQMGLENIRVILPNEIDILINNVISDKINAVLVEHTNVSFKERYSSKLSIQNNSVTPINALRTLYKVKYADINSIDDLKEIIIDNNDILIYTSFSIIYDDSHKYHCRLIENDELFNTLNDYLNGASWDYPIAAMYANSDTEYVKVFTNSKYHVPKQLEISYIAKPNKVKWDKQEQNRVDCNLPEYLHHEIVTDAVNKFIASVSVTNRNNQ